MSDEFAQGPEQMREWAKENNLINSALIGIGVVMVQPFLTATSLDLAATVCVFSFAIAIPVLAALVMISLQEAFQGKALAKGFAVQAKGVFQFIAIVGVVAGFWHIHWMAGVAMVVSGIVAALVYGLGIFRLEQDSKQQIDHSG